MMRHSKVILERCGSAGATPAEIEDALVPFGYGTGFFTLNRTLGRLCGVGWLVLIPEPKRLHVGSLDRVYRLTPQGVTSLNDPNTLAKY